MGLSHSSSTQLPPVSQPGAHRGSGNGQGLKGILIMTAEPLEFYFHIPVSD